MDFIKEKPRSFKKVTTHEGLEHVLKKYVNLHNVFLKEKGESFPLKVVEMNDDLTLLIQHGSVLENDRVHLFTILSRYLEFDAEIVERREKNGEGNQYLLKLITCHIAQEVREDERFDSTIWDLYAGHMTTLKVVENPTSIMRSVSSQLFFKESEKYLEDYAFKRCYFSNEKILPGEVKYAVESGKPLHIKSFKNPEEVFSQDPEFFKKRMDIKDEILKRFTTLNEQYSSMVVRPINYITIDGRSFTIGHLAVASADREMGEEDTARIDSVAETTYKKIRDANLVVTEERIKVIDISRGGLRLQTGNSRLASTLSTQEFVLFSLVFKLQQPIRLSGSIAHIIKENEKSFLIGIAFKGSDFGQKARALIQSHIDKFRKDNAIS